MAERRRRGRPRRDEVVPQRATASETALKNLEMMKRKVSAGKQTRKRWRDDYRVDELAERVYGPRDDDDLGFHDENAIWINKFTPTLQTMLPSLFFHAPKFKIDAISNDASLSRRQQAKIAEALLQRVCLEDHQLEHAVRLAVLQATHSVGVVKLIYNPEMEPNPEKGNSLFETNDVGEPMIDDQTGERRPLLDAEGEPIVEPDEIVTDEVYKIQWVNAENMVFPSRVADMSKWGWVAEEVTVSVEEAKEDKRFKAALRDKIKSNVVPDEESISFEANQEFVDDDEGDFKYIEFYDIKKKRYYAWADGSPETDLEQELLFDEPLQRGFEDHPYAILAGFMPILDPKPNPWPLPLTYNWLPIEREHNTRRLQLANSANRSARKIYYDQSTFPDHEQAVRALQSNVDMEAIMVNDLARLPQSQADTPPPSNLAQDLQALEGDWIRASGLSSAAFGVRAGSATEARIENQIGDVRESDLRRTISIWMETIGRKLYNLVRATMTIGIMVKTASMTDREVSQAIDARFGPGTSEQLATSTGLRQAFVDRFGDERWLEVNREDVTFDADITVVAGSMKSRTIETERQQFLEFMQIVLSSPIGLQSRELLRTLSNLFEFIDDQMVEELVALGEKMAALEAQKAGRFQGEDQGAAGQQAVAAASGRAAPQNGMTLQSLLGGA